MAFRDPDEKRARSFWPRLTCPACSSVALVWWAPSSDDEPINPDPSRLEVIVDTEPDFELSVCMSPDPMSAEMLGMERCACVDCGAMITELRQTKYSDDGERVLGCRSFSFDAIAPDGLEEFDLAFMYARHLGLTEQQRMHARAFTKRRVRMPLNGAPTL